MPIKFLVPPDAHADLLNDGHFAALKSWLIERTGLSYYADKDGDLATALCRSYEGKPPAAAKILRLVGTGESDDLDRIVEQLTIGETFFFRHLEMFHALRDYVIPDILERNKVTRRLRIWSAGCSVGAEPYSLSILLREVLGEKFHDWSIEILGTDINRRFLKIAEKAEYDRWALRGLPEELCQKCFTQHKTKWHLNDQFRKGVRFKHHNLVSDVFPMPTQDLFSFDVVICRNVMIYFDATTIKRLSEQFHQTLVPGGWLAVGHAEPHTEIFQEYHTINAPGAVLYQRASFHSPRRAVAPATQRIAQPPSIAKTEIRRPMVTIPRIAAPERQADIEQLQRLANTGDLPAALACCERLIAEERLNASYHFFRGLILAQLGDAPGASKALSRCLYLQRDLALAHYYLGVVQVSLGESGDRHFRNSRNLLAGRDADEPVPLGDELTTGELRALVAIHLPEQP